MKFNIGDKVSVLDEDLIGIIKSIEGTNITIETSDGFDMIFNASELIFSHTTSELKYDAFKNLSEGDIIKEKSTYKKKKDKSFKPKKQAQAAMEVDLHIEKLIDSTKGMTNFDLLNLQMDTAKRQLEFAIRKRIQRVVFIHGVGEGVLKMELESLFRRYDNVRYSEANPRKYGLGATEVYILQNRNS